MQRATWLNPQNCNPHYTFVEFAECYFDDLAITDAEGGYRARIADGLLTADEAEAVEAFHGLFDRYKSPDGDDYNHEAILNDPAWHDVVAAAQSAKCALLAIIGDLDERQLLTTASLYAHVATRQGPLA